MRPRGTLGDVALAIVAAAEEQPGTVRELATRAGVGYDVARYTASRLVGAGQLVELEGGRPAKLAPPPAAPTGLSHAFQVLARSFWGQPA